MKRKLNESDEEMKKGKMKESSIIYMVR